ncbi:MAG: DDE-type integrase/transposase/recombinase [Sedimenticola sp.]
MERIALDIIGPLTTTERGNRWILVVSDYFTRWAEAFPLKDHKAQAVAETLVNEVICRFGTPYQLHTDQGTDFESKLFQEICRLLQIKKTRTTAYHPQSDGLVERLNRTVIDMLSKFVNAKHTDWDIHIPAVMMSYRTSIHETTDFTPAFLMLGRELKLPVEIMYGQPNGEQGSTNEYARAVRDRMHSAFQHTRQNMAKAQVRQKEYYDRNAFGDAYQVGDKVWLHEPATKRGLTKKLRRPWCGPYLVKDKISDLVYKIQMEGTRACKVVHFNRLKPCSWLKPAEDDDDRRVNGAPPVPNNGFGALHNFGGEEEVSDDSDIEDQHVAEPQGVILPIPPPSPNQVHGDESENDEENQEVDDRVPEDEDNQPVVPNGAPPIDDIVRTSSRRRQKPGYLSDYDCA